jgi:pullulanase-type alpha-1,6-glucosidase
MQTAPRSVVAKCRRLTASVAFLCLWAAGAGAADTPAPAKVTIAGSFQSQLGCAGNWQPACASTHLVFDASDGVWKGTFTIPAGSWEYKAALNDSWDENYGAHASRGGANIALALAETKVVKFYYSHDTHWVTDNVGSVIATAPGSYQALLGCPGNWDPACLRAWLQDPHGDGIYTFSTRALPAGGYEMKAAIGESWAENYGAGGVRDGANIPFTVPADCAEIVFRYDAATHVLSVGPAGPPPEPANVTIAGSLQSPLGCPGDWQADCAVTHLGFHGGDRVWQGSFYVPSGSWEYKAALNDSWAENYGANATRNGANISLSLAAARQVKFYYDHRTHWVTSNGNATIATAPGNYQHLLGCAGDWDPTCLRSWLQDPHGDGTYGFSTRALPAGNYEVKVAINESWDENYGDGGAPNGPNIRFAVPNSCAEMFFRYDAVSHLLSVGAQGAPRGNLTRARAHWLSRDTVAWDVGTVRPGWTFKLHYAAGGGLGLSATGVTGGIDVPVAYDPAGLSADLRARFPHLAGRSAFKIAAARLAEFPEALRSQLAVSVTDGAGQLVDATALQIPGALDDLYTYNGPLGATFSRGVPTLRVWAPTVRSVKLHLFADAKPATTASVLDMTPGPSGVWAITGDASWSGRFYLYEVEVFARSSGRVEHNLVTDPYSLGLSRNSQRSQIVDLSQRDLRPAGWDRLRKPGLDAPEDIVLYELHVRDFSANDPSVPEALRGTFKAFTQTDSNGMRHLAALARAGLTHVHLLPSFDFASVNEDKSLWQTPAGDLESFPPNSDRQQAAVMAVADKDGFNWGYDPWHYTVPEGSYATDPDGTSRILEFRQMVQALNRHGLRVVMDVVYNHTSAAGQSDQSVLDRIVPGYYHRLNADGNVETSSCCPNTASEHNMMEKLLIDSVLTWARAYKVDGFRFDIMGHHMKRNMVKLRQALDALTPAADGVDGRKVYVYGEGWNFGEVANNAQGVNATQANMAGTGIGTFNDRIRDGARGGGPFGRRQEQGFLTGLFYDPNATDQGPSGDQQARLLQRTDWIRVGLAGNLASYRFVDRFGHLVTGADVDYNGQHAGYTADPQEVINYVDAHDDETLFDAIQLKAAASASVADRVRMQGLGMSLVTLAQGIPFVHAGIEMLRSKSLDRNSYNSGDWFNRLDFTYASDNWGVGLPPARDNQSNWGIMGPLLADPALKPGPADIQEALAHFREALTIRKSSKLFRLRTADDVNRRLQFHNTGPGQLPGLIVMGLSDADGSVDRRHDQIVVLFNANRVGQSFTLGDFAGRRFILHPAQRASHDPLVRTASFDRRSGTFAVPARTAAVFWTLRRLDERIRLLESDVDGLAARGILNGGSGDALEGRLESARGHLGRGTNGTAINQLLAFINEARALVNAGILTPEQGGALSGEAQSIVDQADGETD